MIKKLCFHLQIKGVPVNRKTYKYKKKQTENSDTRKRNE